MTASMRATRDTRTNWRKCIGTTTKSRTVFESPKEIWHYSGMPIDSLESRSSRRSGLLRARKSCVDAPAARPLRSKSARTRCRVSNAVVDMCLQLHGMREFGSPTLRLISAIRAAIRGGRLELVQRIWNAGGTLHPSLSYVDVANDSKRVKKSAPVTLLLSREGYKDRPWAGLEIAKWLVAKGCDIHAHGADGRTLLHIAARAGDVEMVRYILSQGVPASTPGAFSLPALGSAEDEDVVLTLLDAGTDLSKMDNGGAQFRRYAIYNHWGRVLAWLDTHKSVSP